MARHIPIQYAVRQGCPLSMILFALWIQPLLSILDKRLPCITIGKTRRSIKVVAYTDDETVFITLPTDFDTVRSALQQYKKATGARLNSTKSITLANVRWTAPATVLGIKLYTQTKIPGASFGTSIEITPRNWRESLAQSKHKHVTPMEETFV
jgi:hypothetical protein